MLGWFLALQLGTLAAGAAIGAALLQTARWAAQKVRYNRLPVHGEPSVFISNIADQRLPNGAILRIEIKNGHTFDVWVNEITAVSRSGGLIYPIPVEAIASPETITFDVFPNASLPSIKPNQRIRAGEGFVYFAWVGGREWPISKVSLAFKWSPYGPAARQSSFTVHCKF